MTESQELAEKANERHFAEYAEAMALAVRATALLEQHMRAASDNGIRLNRLLELVEKAMDHAARPQIAFIEPPMLFGSHQPGAKAAT